jgi:TPR repeat protein
VPRDFDRAIELFDQAAAQGDQYGVDRAAEARAERDCGLSAAAPYEAGYEAAGRGVESIDAATAVPACEEAVRLDPNSLEDRTWLARAYLAAGRGEEAVRLLEAAIAGDWDPALVELGDALVYGAGVPADPARAFSLYGEAAGRRFGPAELGLGISYQLGLGVPADLNQAEQWFRRALAHGYANAQPSLDTLQHLRANPIGGPQRAMLKG